MIKAIIWDMDGVLIDSEHTHAKIESEALSKFEIDIPPEEITKRYSGIKIDEEFADAISRSGKTVNLELLMKTRDQLIKQQFTGKVLAVPFAKEVLNILAKSFLQAVATSTEKEFAQKVLKRNRLLSFFDAQMFGNMVKKSKPDPEIFLQAAKLLKVIPAESVVIEDSLHGFTAAKKAGMTLIARKGSHNQSINFSLADYIIDDLREIPNIIQSINNQAI